MNSTRSHLKLCCFGQQMHFRHIMALNRSANTRSLFGFGKKKSEKPKQLTEPIDTEIQTQLTEEEIMKMRDVSRLPALVKSQLSGQNIPSIKYLWQMRIPWIRQYYALWGKASGLKPGIMWPSKEELEWQKGYEKAFCKPFPQLMEEMRESKRIAAKIKKDREDDVMSKLKQLPKFKKEFWQRYHEMQDQLREEKAKKEKLIQEVREFVGYDLDPKDPRFEEALLKKDEEKKREMKAQKKQEKVKAALERLQALANEAMEREQQDQTILDKSKTQTKSEENN